LLAGFKFYQYYSGLTLMGQA